MTTLNPTSIEQIGEAMRDRPPIVAHGGRTKAPLVASEDEATQLDMRELAGVIEYEPGEFTFTAHAGTTLRDIEAMLAENGQYLPFDPPLVDRGATLGGTVAAGMSGPGRLRFGGVRDFVIGVKVIDGTSRLIRGGGKVVKNAAGFDLPKLMVGSMGRLGVMTELTFKVFPRPGAWRSIRVTCRDLADAVQRMAELVRQPLELEALDLEPPATLMLRISGDPVSLGAHAKRVAEATQRECQTLDGEPETAYWHKQRELSWVPTEHHLVRLAISPRQVMALEAVLERENVPRRYAVAGNLAWVAWPVDRPTERLALEGFRGLIVQSPEGAVAGPRVGEAASAAEPFARAVKSALDPQGRMPGLV